VQQQNQPRSDERKRQDLAYDTSGDLNRVMQDAPEIFHRKLQAYNGHRKHDENRQPNADDRTHHDAAFYALA